MLAWFVNPDSGSRRQLGSGNSQWQDLLAVHGGDDNRSTHWSKWTVKRFDRALLYIPRIILRLDNDGLRDAGEETSLFWHYGREDNVLENFFLFGYGNHRSLQWRLEIKWICDAWMPTTGLLACDFPTLKSRCICCWSSCSCTLAAVPVAATLQQPSSLLFYVYSPWLMFFLILIDATNQQYWLDWILIERFVS
jgi:hypothetical protein